MFKRFLDPLMLRVLNEEASKIAEKARQNASWSSKIPGAIRSNPAEIISDGVYQVSITVDTSENGAPMARAFEYGSGERATRGEKKDYKIPKEPTGVSFLWKYPSPLGRKKVPGDEFVSFAQIYHPGVAPKPYLRPAFEKNKPSMKTRFASFIKRGLLDSIKVEFKNDN